MKCPKLEPGFISRKVLKRQLGDMAYKTSSCRRYITQETEGFRILNYHSITENFIRDDWKELTTPKDLFKKHMQILYDERYNVIDCQTAIAYLVKHSKIPSKTVVITFDDGFKDAYLNALPILNQYKFPSTLFIVTNYLEGLNYINYSEIKEIKKTDLIHFGCHSLTHKKLTFLDESELRKEICLSKKMLEEIVGEEITLFAYPFGSFDSYNKKIINLVKSAGFNGAFSSIFGLNTLNTDRFLLKRNRISWFDTESEFKKHLAGAYDWYALWQKVRS